jgi:hypothetical protein
MKIELDATLGGESTFGSDFDLAPKWEYKTQFGINDKMKEVIEATIKVCNQEIARNKRKIDKLVYGV